MEAPALTIDQTIETNLHPVRVLQNPTSIHIGGSEDKTGSGSILQKVASFIGDYPIYIITYATDYPEDYFEEYKRAFLACGIPRYQIVHVQDIHTNLIDILDEIEQTDVDSLQAPGRPLMFITGGQQDKEMHTLEIMALQRVTTLASLRERVQALQQAKKIVVAGTSAGAMLQSEEVILGLDDDEKPDNTNIKLIEGIGNDPDIIFDTHGDKRHREARMRKALRLYAEQFPDKPLPLGIMIGNNKAVIHEHGGPIEVIGEGTPETAGIVRVFKYDRVEDIPPDGRPDEEYPKEFILQNGIYDLNEFPQALATYPPGNSVLRNQRTLL